MKDKTFSSLVRRLAVFSVLIALIASVYAFEAATPQEASASSHGVQIVPPGWYMAPSGLHNRRTVPADIPVLQQAQCRTCNHLNLQQMDTDQDTRRPMRTSGNTQLRSVPSSAPKTTTPETTRPPPIRTTTRASPFTGSTATRSPTTTRTSTTAPGTTRSKIRTSSAETVPTPPKKPITRGPAANTTAQKPSDDSTSQALGNADESVRVGRPNSSDSGNGPLSSDGTEDFNDTRPMYGLSPGFRDATAQFRRVGLSTTHHAQTH